MASAGRFSARVITLAMQSDGGRMELFMVMLRGSPTEPATKVYLRMMFYGRKMIRLNSAKQNISLNKLNLTNMKDPSRLKNRDQIPWFK
jgi:hypothetical protein